MALNIADLFEHAVDVVPDNPALQGAGPRRHLRGARAESNKLAHYLASQGVEPGDHVGIYAKNSVEHVVAVLAVVKIRAVNINVNYRYVEGELNYLFDNADVKALVFERPYAPIVANCAPQARAADHVRRHPRRDRPGQRRRHLVVRRRHARGGDQRTRAPSATSPSAATTTCTSSTPAARPASPRA